MRGRPGLAGALLLLFLLTAMTLAVSFLLFVRGAFWLPPVLPVGGPAAWQVDLLAWDYLREYREKRPQEGLRRRLTVTLAAERFQPHHTRFSPRPAKRAI